jgi:hypothetical protein
LKFYNGKNMQLCNHISLYIIVEFKMYTLKWKKIAQILGGIIFNEIYKIDLYKLNQNRGTHKGKLLLQNTVHIQYVLI